MSFSQLSILARARGLQSRSGTWNTAKAIDIVSVTINSQQETWGTAMVQTLPSLWLWWPWAVS